MLRRMTVKQDFRVGGIEWPSQKHGSRAVRTLDDRQVHGSWHRIARSHANPNRFTMLIPWQASHAADSFSVLSLLVEMNIMNGSR